MLIQFGPFGPESDERFHVHGGNDQIAHGLAARLPAGTLQLAHPLRSVRRDGDRYALSFADLPDETRADVLVLCVPFTALRRVDTSGLGLTRRKRQCIEQLGMGTNAKLLLQFDRHLSHYDNWNGELYDEHVDTWNSSLGEPGWNGHAWLDHWASDPWTHGSYAAFEPGQYTRYWGFAGRREGRVLFGGEHTALSAQGYLEGAVRSGERCAREVAALMS
jgi:monoamine oxidase